MCRRKRNEDDSDKHNTQHTYIFMRHSSRWKRLRGSVWGLCNWPPWRSSRLATRGSTSPSSPHPAGEMWMCEWERKNVNVRAQKFICVSMASTRVFLNASLHVCALEVVYLIETLDHMRKVHPGLACLCHLSRCMHEEERASHEKEVRRECEYTRQG